MCRWNGCWIDWFFQRLPLELAWHAKPGVHLLWLQPQPWRSKPVHPPPPPDARLIAFGISFSCSFICRRTKNCQLGRQWGGWTPGQPRFFYCWKIFITWDTWQHGSTYIWSSPQTTAKYDFLWPSPKKHTVGGYNIGFLGGIPGNWLLLGVSN